jgi:hypothetical protein
MILVFSISVDKIINMPWMRSPGYESKRPEKKPSPHAIPSFPCRQGRILGSLLAASCFIFPAWMPRSAVRFFLQSLAALGFLQVSLCLLPWKKTKMQ